MKRLTVVASVWCLLLCIGIDFFYFPPTIGDGDEGRFISEAQHFLSAWKFAYGTYRAWEMPGTGAFFALCGANITAIRIVQALIVIAQAWLIGRLSWQIFRNRTAASLAVLMGMFYPFFLYYQGLALSETLYTFLVVLAFGELYFWRQYPDAEGPIITACLFAAAAYVKPTMLFLPPFLFLRPRAIAVAALVYCAALSPWIIRNYEIFGTFILTTGASGNLYLGNNDHNPEGGVEWDRDVDKDWVNSLAGLSEVERSNAYHAKAMEWIDSHPADFARVTTKKFIRFWNFWPNSAALRDWARITTLSFGPVLILAIVCSFTWPKRRDLLPIWLTIAYFTVLHSVVIASLRYRLPIEPLLIVMASWPLARGWEELSKKAGVLVRQV